MYKLEGIIKVEINNKVIYYNDLNHDLIAIPNRNEIAGPKSSDNDIIYPYVKIVEKDHDGNSAYKEDK